MDNKNGQLRKAQIYILNEIKRICVSNHIDYFLDGGSMLGAVRHQGFIPWDDDIDVGMTIKNYRKFLAIAEQELGTDFFVDNYEHNEEYALVFSKIRLKGTTYIELKGNADALHNEIFVDVFPYYYVSDNIVVRNLEAQKMRILSQTLLEKSRCRVWAGEGVVKRLKFIPIDLLSVFLSKKYMYRKMEKILVRHNNTNYMCVHAGGRFYSYWNMPSEIFRNYVMASFEGELYPILREYDRYLTIGYGDYMKLPPENKRMTHNIVKLELGSYIF